MRKDVGKRPQTSPSICTGTCVLRISGDLAKISCEVKDFVDGQEELRYLRTEGLPPMRRLPS